MSLKVLLNYSSAQTIVRETLAEARRNQLKPVAVCVLDSGGQLVAYGREDGCSNMREQIARAKAWGSLGLGMPTRNINYSARPGFWNSAFAASGGRIIDSPGGVLVADDAGDIIGAVGVSGDLGQEDEAAAIAGIKAAGLAPNPATRSAKL